MKSYYFYKQSFIVERWFGIILFILDLHFESLLQTVSIIFKLLLAVIYQHCLGEQSKKKCPNKWKKSKRGGGGVSAGDHKVHNSKCGLFDKRGGGARFTFFFPNVNEDFKCFS